MAKQTGTDRETYYSTRHMPLDYLDALHILQLKLEPQRKLWQVFNMALKRGIRALAEERGIEGVLIPTAKTQKVGRVRELPISNEDMGIEDQA